MVCDQLRREAMKRQRTRTAAGLRVRQSSTNGALMPKSSIIGFRMNFLIPNRPHLYRGLWNLVPFLDAHLHRPGFAFQLTLGSLIASHVFVHVSHTLPYRCRTDVRCPKQTLTQIGARENDFQRENKRKVLHELSCEQAPSEEFEERCVL